MRPGIEGVEIDSEVFPAEGEPVVEKSNPNRAPRHRAAGRRAAPDLELGDRTIPGDVVHGAFMAALADGYAEVTSAAELLARD